MYKVKIFSIGKTKEPWLASGIDEYVKRLKPIMTIEWNLVKNENVLKTLLEKETAYICLDPSGIILTSEDFSKFLCKELLKGNSRLSFVIGGAEGISSEIKKKSHFLLSLSPLTFTHQLTRLILLEQLYRALEIQKGSAYHK